jgi:hypothetical protein
MYAGLYRNQQKNGRIRHKIAEIGPMPGIGMTTNRRWPVFAPLAPVGIGLASRALARSFSSDQ